MTETLQPGWFSAMAQGQAMSLLVRAYYITGHTTFLQVARRALWPFSVPVPKGVLGSLDGPWFEEYPSAHPLHVLNGFMFSLLGLYDLAPYSRKAAHLYWAGRRSLLTALPRFDAPGISRYDLAVLASQTYNHVHVVELRALDSVGPSPVLKYWAAKSRRTTSEGRTDELRD
jgi:heparosan-N-sulfate-glucuronate 5-epimerase